MKYIIVKAYNNNVLGVIDLNGVKRILVGNGIGFGARPNHLFTKYDDVAASFVLEDSKNRKSFQQLADDVDAGLLLLVEQQLKIIQQTLGVRLNENIHITLLDHISFPLTDSKKDWPSTILLMTILVSYMKRNTHWQASWSTALMLIAT